MHPVLLHIGSFELRTYGALGALAFLMSSLLILRYGDRRGWSRDAVVDLLFWSALSAIAGARLMFAVQNPGTITPARLFDLRSGGMVYYGAPLLGVPVFLALSRRKGLPVLGLFDCLGIFAPLAHAVARVGCFGAGCCYGAPTSVPWAVTYTDPLTSAPHGVPVHPVQLYESLGLLGISALAAWLDGRGGFAGRTGLVWLGGYALLRMGVEAFRGDADRGFVGPLSTSQAIATGVLLVVAIAWVALSRRSDTRAQGGDSAGRASDQPTP